MTEIDTDILRAMWMSRAERAETELADFKAEFAVLDGAHSEEMTRAMQAEAMWRQWAGRALNAEARVQRIIDAAWDTCENGDWHEINYVLPRILRAAGVEGPWEQHQ